MVVIMGKKKYELNQRKPLNVSFLDIAKKRLASQSRNFSFFLISDNFHSIGI